MIKHYIIMSSSYSDGKRIAFDVICKDSLNIDEINRCMTEIKQYCGEDVPLSTHFIETDSESWDSVQQYDPFFEDVELTSTVQKFVEKVSKDRVLSGLDVANYILSKIKCTHLALQKLTYLSYADYLCTTSKRLFEDTIYAFTYGPVVKSVYDTFKRSGHAALEPKNDHECSTEVKQMPAQSRILFAIDGTQKLKSIDLTIAKYQDYTASALVDLTHRKGSPWNRIYDDKMQYNEIPDDLIKEYHCVEQ